MHKIRVLLADDHAILRAGLKMLLDAEPDMEVVGEAGNGVAAIQKTGELKPDVVLMDITMPELNGLHATREILQAHSDAKVLVLTVHDDESYLRQFLRAGASGYVVKKAADTELTAAIRSVYKGDIFVHSSLARVMMEEYLGNAVKPARQTNQSHPLSEREKEVLTLIAQGYTNKEAAKKLYISVKTVETHRARIMEKLQLRTRAELVRYAIMEGFLNTNV
ncbi:MAG: response regulator [Planctomycetota bacterium]|jgi:two-component system response regulator NreC